MAIVKTDQIASGEGVLDASNPTPILHGLKNCTSFVATLKSSAALGDLTHVLTAVISGDTANVYAWAPISGSDPTLVASTGTESFYWIATGS